MKFYRVTQKGSDWNEEYEALSVEASDILPEGVHTDAWVLVQLESTREPLSAPEIRSRIRVTEGTSYPMGEVNTSLSRLVRKGYVTKEDWE